METPLTEPPSFRLLLPRQALLLGLMMLCLAGVCLWMLIPTLSSSSESSASASTLSTVPNFLWSGTVSVSLLAHVLTGVLILLLSLLAPFLIGTQSEDESLRHRLTRMVYLSLWVAVLEFFVLLVASRITPLETLAMLKTTAMVAFLSITLQLLAATFTRAYTGIVFLWMVAMPVSAYFMAEIFLMSPAGGRGWQEVSSPEIQTLHDTLHRLLNLSPGTFILGIFDGKHVDNSAIRWGYPLTLFTAACLLSILILARRRRIHVAQCRTESVASGVVS
jgi:hypothetical protein